MMPTIGCPITMGPGEFVRAIERDQTCRPFPVVGLEAVGEAESGALRTGIPGSPTDLSKRRVR